MNIQPRTMHHTLPTREELFARSEKDIEDLMAGWLKPRVRPWGGVYACWALRMMALGATPELAFEAWKSKVLAAST